MACTGAGTVSGDWLPIPQLSAADYSRFNSNLVELENGCWAWKGYKNQGAGYFKIKGVRYFTHRIMFAEKYGRENMDASLAIRVCGQRDCSNPDHIILGDTQDLAAIRKKTDSYHRWDGDRIGEANPNAKLTDEDTIAIYNSDSPIKQLCECYGVKSSTVWAIRSGRRKIPALEQAA